MSAAKTIQAVLCKNRKDWNCLWSSIKDYFKDSMNTYFSFGLVSNRRNVYEEVLILDEIGLVGSLGGSLGLFVGFSFFGYVTPLLEVLFDGVADYF